eukprot:7995481-Karenia_brevis.AAC.1
MKQSKIDRYGSYLHELEANGIFYRPAMVSCYGRFHPDATKMMKLACRKAASRQGLGESSALYTRWRRSLTTECWRRAARMVLGCLPAAGEMGDWLFGWGDHPIQTDDDEG